MPVMNDQWMSEPSSQLIWQMRKDADKDMNMLEAVVTIAEVDTIEYQDSPSVYFFLAKLYQDLPEELSFEAKRQIEIEKLRAEGKEHILDMPRDSKTIIANMGPNPTFAQSIPAANDYMHRMCVEAYLSKDNAQRAVLNLNKGIEKSDGNPKPYEELLNTTSSAFLLDERIQPYLGHVSLSLKYHRK